MHAIALSAVADPVSLSGSLTPFVYGAIWAVITLGFFGAITLKNAKVDEVKVRSFAVVPVEWSLPESWVTTITGGSSALLALLGASDALDALLGTAPEDAKAKLVIIAAFSALLVAAAPLVATVAGWGKETTWQGLILAALFTLTGAMGLMSGVWITFAEAHDPDTAIGSLGGVIVIAMHVLVGAYAALTLRELVLEKSKFQAQSSIL